MKKNTLIFASTCVGMLLFGITLITLGAIAPAILQRFSLSVLHAGALFSILPFGVLAGSILFGPVSDRFGYKPVLVASCVCIFAGFQGLAFAGTLTILNLSVFLFGLGGGAINGATNALTADISDANKTANLSLLGVFFALGALGMPVLLGVLNKYASTTGILSATAYFTLATGIIYALMKFPEAKQKHGISFSRVADLTRDKFVILTGLFLFFQSGFEGVINNWTTTYLSKVVDVSREQALYSLSLYVAGMAVMRLLLGSALRSLSPTAMLIISFVFLATGSLVLATATLTYGVATMGLLALGVGLAAGFPLMLGLTGERYPAISGTAFSVVISIALVGNTILNYLTGLIAESMGIKNLPYITLVMTAVMVFLSWWILKLSKTKLNNVS
jgi:MFS transporter, FHS family, glucose/mannose:H+ symporter